MIQKQQEERSKQEEKKDLEKANNKAEKLLKRIKDLEGLTEEQKIEIADLTAKIQEYKAENVKLQKKVE